MLWSTRCTAPSEARAAFVAAPTAARRPPPSGFCFPRGAHGRHQHLSSRRRSTGTPHTCPWLLRRHRPLLGAFARPLEMPFCDSAAPPRLDCSACARPHDRLARARAGSPSRCSSLRPPPLLFAACQGSRLVDVVGLSASHVQCSSAGCDACVRFPTDSACSAKVSLRRPRESESVRRVRPSSQSVESARLVLSSSSRQRPVSPGCPLIVHLPIWLRFLMFLFVIWRTLLALDRPVLRQGGCVFALLSFAGTLAWTPRALLPGDALRFSGASDHSLVCLEAPPSSAFLNAWTFFCERKPNMAMLSGVFVLRLTRRERLASLPSQVC